MRMEIPDYPTLPAARHTVLSGLLSDIGYLILLFAAGLCPVSGFCTATRQNPPESIIPAESRTPKALIGMCSNIHGAIPEMRPNAADCMKFESVFHDLLVCAETIACLYRAAMILRVPTRRHGHESAFQQLSDRNAGAATPSQANLAALNPAHANEVLLTAYPAAQFRPSSSQKSQSPYGMPGTIHHTLLLRWPAVPACQRSADTTALDMSNGAVWFAPVPRCGMTASGKRAPPVKLRSTASANSTVANNVLSNRPSMAFLLPWNQRRHPGMVNPAGTVRISLRFCPSMGRQGGSIPLGVTLHLIITPELEVCPTQIHSNIGPVRFPIPYTGKKKGPSYQGLLQGDSEWLSAGSSITVPG